MTTRILGLLDSNDVSILSSSVVRSLLGLTAFSTLATGTSSQYVRGDGVLATLPNPISNQSTGPFLVDTSSVSLGGTAGNAITPLTLKSIDNNVDNIQFILKRDVDGTSWDSASWRIRRLVDSSQLAYIDLYGQGNTQAFSFGRDNSDLLTIGATGKLTSVHGMELSKRLFIKETDSEWSPTTGRYVGLQMRTGSGLPGSARLLAYDYGASTYQPLLIDASFTSFNGSVAISAIGVIDPLGPLDVAVSSAGRFIMRASGSNVYLDAVKGDKSDFAPLNMRGSTLTFNGNNVAYDGSNARFNQLSIGAISGPVAVTTSGDLISVSIKNTGTNGANLQLVGDGSTNPNKTIRAKGGSLEFINHAYSAVIASLSDTGQFFSGNGFKTSTTSEAGFDYQPGGTRLLIRSAAGNATIDAVVNNNSVFDVLRFRGTDMLFNSNRVAYEGSTPRFSSMSIGADSDILLYETATNRFCIRTGNSSAWQYSQFWENGDFTNSGKVIAGTDVTGNTLIARASTVLRGVGAGFLYYEHQSPHVAFYKKTGQSNYYWRRSDDGLSSGANTAELMALNDSGNLAIGGSFSTPSTLNAGGGDSIIGNSIIGGGRIELNSQGSGDRYSYIDFHSDNTNTDYSARIMRGLGAGGSLVIQNAGAGPIYFSTSFGTQLYLRSDGWNFLNNTPAGFKAYDTGNWLRMRIGGGAGIEVQNEQNASKGSSDLQQAAYLAVGNYGGGYSMKDNAGSGNYYGGIWTEGGLMFLGCTAGNAVNVTKSTSIGPNGEVYLRGSGGNRGDFTIDSSAPTITCYDNDRGSSSWIHYDSGNHGFLQDNSFAWAARRDTNNDWVCTNNIIAYASDRRLKTNIFPASYGEVSRVIDALQVVEFDWNPEAINRLNPGFNPDAQHETGGIAQQFRSIEPRFVSISSVNGVETIKWDKLSPYMLMEIQKHKEDKQQMQQEINELKMAVAMLMEKLK